MNVSVYLPTKCESGDSNPDPSQDWILNLVSLLTSPFHLVVRPVIARVVSHRLVVRKLPASRLIRETSASPQKPLRDLSSFRPGFTRMHPLKTVFHVDGESVYQVHNVIDGRLPGGMPD